MKSKLRQRKPRRNKRLDKKKKSDKLFRYAKYSGLALQMGLVIILGTWGGYQIDQYFEYKFPAFTLLLSLTAVILAIYWAIKDFIK
ncbi:MAG: hypothetical protein CSB06_03475 [Bacteroidia bacterium]|nr:MAG: hypothetical protein CSB06_03475 [Bacteroidia bacterium]